MTEPRAAKPTELHHAEASAEGILNIDKPSGLTSHDVVYRVRKATGQKRVGHAGTLDPLATGVLLVCLGQATRVSEYLMEGEKVYRARVRLGLTTSTYDAEGEVTSRSEVRVSQAQVQAALRQLCGKLQQVPPIYSAIKVDGRRLYQSARRGQQVEVPPRSVEVFSIEWVEWAPPELQIDIRCSKGTYIRSLAHDLGQLLGCGAFLAGLVRRSSGAFHIEHSLRLQDLEQIIRAGGIEQVLHPMDVALGDFPAVAVDALSAKRILSGGVVDLPASFTSDMCRAYATDGRMIALLRRTAEGWQPHKVFGQVNHASDS